MSGPPGDGDVTARDGRVAVAREGMAATSPGDWVAVELAAAVSGGLAVGVVAGVGRCVGACVGLGVGRAVGRGVGLGVGRGVGEAATTVIVPFICSGWIWQKYGYVPGVVKLCE